MSFSCVYKRDNYEYTLELTEEEYEEVAASRRKIDKLKKDLANLIRMYEELSPSRVSRRALTLDVDTF